MYTEKRKNKKSYLPLGVCVFYFQCGPRFSRRNEAPWLFWHARLARSDQDAQTSRQHRRWRGERESVAGHEAAGSHGQPNADTQGAEGVAHQHQAPGHLGVRPEPARGDQLDMPDLRHGPAEPGARQAAGVPDLLR